MGQVKRMTEKELESFWEKELGDAPGLFVPEEIRRTLVNAGMGPTEILIIGVLLGMIAHKGQIEPIPYEELRKFAGVSLKRLVKIIADFQVMNLIP